ncbi:DUF4105 domain-containing protein [Marinomonas algarum]|uniref:DUF4105 domain-containing protein n=1 Tax=Marinomonas algarum TaxID=2883105 RepID=A0A9X1IKM8_9GAMM|nr:DUF4105 domain-containing protein [Marinomonas algarum]MCB5161013.1 DUF4105 domain-containing protein [Marinomonas algarum]
MPFLIFFVSLLLPFSVLAFAVPSEQKDDAYISELAQHSSWLDLLHYHQIGIISPYESQVDDDSFFLSATGKTDPLAELQATLTAFSTPFTGEDINTAPQCTYPARFNWLKGQQMGKDFIEVDCPEFQDWYNTIDGESIHLVFPAAYLNSPSSMYGHTLLRVKKKGNDAPLLDYAVNYAANHDPEDNQLVFSYKGLTGGYPGVISITPFHQKVKEYNFLENRDIWEYKLDFSQEEVNQFVRHVWEMRNTYIEYYFFSENCSYQLLAMLDASSDKLNTTKDFSLWAIPADTVRALKEADLIQDISYRPSIANQVQHMLKSLSDEQITQVKTLVDQEELLLDGLDNFNTEEQAQILEVAYQYSRYLSAKKKSTRSYLNTRSMKLLSLRSKYAQSTVFTDTPVPEIRDDEGHKTQRLAFTIGETGDKAFTQLEYRPSYHDLLDAKGGYLEGAELSMFSGSVSIMEEENIRIEDISLINIRSLSPANALSTPKSWQVNLSFVRDSAIDDAMVFRLKGGAGITEQVGNHLFSALLNGRASLNSDYQDLYDRSYKLQVGPQLQWLYSGDTHRIMASYQYLDDVNEHKANEHITELEWAYLLHPDWQVRTKVAQEKRDSREENTVQISLLHYF